MQTITIQINATIELPDNCSIDELMEKVENEESQLVITNTDGSTDEIELQYASLIETND